MERFLKNGVRDVPGLSCSLLQLIFTVIAVMLFITACGKTEKLSISPLKAGDEFIFEEINSSTEMKGKSYVHIPFQHVYKIKPGSGGGFNIEFIIRARDLNGKILDNNISQKQSYSQFDKYGRLTGRSTGRISSQIKGNYTKLWLPPSKRKKGEKIKFSMSGSEWQVSGPVKWGVWDAWKATCMAPYAKSKNGRSALYFDKKSGFNVGNRIQHLTGTNIKNLKTADSKVDEVIENLKKRGAK